MSRLEHSVVCVLTDAGAANPHAVFLELKAVFEGHGYRRPPPASRYQPVPPESSRRHIAAIRAQLAARDEGRAS